jgi:hypothetical protein
MGNRDVDFGGVADFPFWMDGSGPRIKKLLALSQTVNILLS